ncbi:hypothetical protein GCK72_025028 [Caenorhabditis remanei]|uniref:Uncharacterized protein n=1 Tax=Caenorhabditis remanei TaxID=31234 RepID=A0A6A5G1C7_CAERE|nr:hypothetical protein GCK72_025028 [Caenorhabditis remanei]KAF1748561.1 hypothetical protein GCK72_025028 [Caenorhabditis remanei]
MGDKKPPMKPSDWKLPRQPEYRRPTMRQESDDSRRSRPPRDMRSTRAPPQSHRISPYRSVSPTRPITRRSDGSPGPFDVQSRQNSEANASRLRNTTRLRDTTRQSDSNELRRAPVSWNDLSRSMASQSSNRSMDSQPLMQQSSSLPKLSGSGSASKTNNLGYKLPPIFPNKPIDGIHGHSKKSSAKTEATRLPLIKVRGKSEPPMMSSGKDGSLMRESDVRGAPETQNRPCRQKTESRAKIHPTSWDSLAKQQKIEKEDTVEELIGRVNSDVGEELSNYLEKLVPPRTTTDPFPHSVQTPSTSDRSSNAPSLVPLRPKGSEHKTIIDDVNEPKYNLKQLKLGNLADNAGGTGLSGVRSSEPASPTKTARVQKRKADEYDDDGQGPAKRPSTEDDESEVAEQATTYPQDMSKLASWLSEFTKKEESTSNPGTTAAEVKPSYQPTRQVQKEVYRLPQKEPGKDLTTMDDTYSPQQSDDERYRAETPIQNFDESTRQTASKKSNSNVKRWRPGRSSSHTDIYKVTVKLPPDASTNECQMILKSLEGVRVTQQTMDEATRQTYMKTRGVQYDNAISSSSSLGQIPRFTSSTRPESQGVIDGYEQAAITDQNRRSRRNVGRAREARSHLQNGSDSDSDDDNSGKRRQ